MIVMKCVDITAFGMNLRLMLICTEGQVKLYEENSPIPISSLFVVDGRRLDLASEDSITIKVIKQLESEHLIQEIPHHFSIYRRFMMLENFL